MSEDVQALVIDNGSHSLKVGKAGDDLPSIVVPSLVGRTKNSESISLNGGYPSNCFVGENAQSNREMLNISYPIEQGIIKDWDGMTKLWHYCFYNGLRVAPEEHPVLLTEPSLNSKQVREKMTQVFFETFSVPAMYLSIQGVLAVYGSGRTTGVVCEVGDGVTHTLPLWESYPIPHALGRIDISGRDLTDYLMKLLCEKGYSFSTINDRETVREIKEKLCYVASDPELVKEKVSVDTQTYELPNGQTVTLGNERFQCPEALFQPSLIGANNVGFHELVYNTISKCDVNCRKDFYSNILLMGGTTYFPGFKDRLQSELATRIPASTKIRIIDSPERNRLVWIGGSILASLSSISGMWISKEDYDENGPTVVHMKCQ